MININEIYHSNIAILYQLIDEISNLLENLEGDMVRFNEDTAIDFKVRQWKELLCKSDKKTWFNIDAGRNEPIS